MDRSREIADAIVTHYQSVKRDLPWRRTRDPYAIWVSEIMLQQTRVATVIPYWERWMAKFPTVATLAAAPLDDVLAVWAGLGYYSRARNLHAGAKVVGDALPRTASELRGVPGIGPYTAGAIASIAYGERAPLVDGNVSRVLARVFAIEDDVKSTKGTKALWIRAGALMTALAPAAEPGELNQGLMELGATICTPTSPRCLVCPLAALCAAKRLGRQDELPVMPARKKQEDLPLLARTHVWIQFDDEIVVGRRPAEGLFGGLWELPDLDAAKRLGVTIDREPVAFLSQILTHRRLDVTVVRGRGLARDADPGYEAIRRIRIADVETLGVAAVTVAILRKYQDSPWTSIPRPSLSSPRATRRSSKASAFSASTSKTTTSPTRPRARRKASTSLSTIKHRPRPR
ncbi:MAG: A/G-specific adenine glycosylase [Myxococcota bacterium]|nr:A/G-specific adenine glycosylase [Deltaproteobacteria bacterium]MDQ3335536.1 A/G-specific adenine glycosylase [Myxococcota bacterium]